MPVIPEFDGSLFLEGPAGSGKTTAAASHLLELIDSGVNPESILVLVPQFNLAAPYSTSLAAIDIGISPTITTFSAFARQLLRRFWPVIAAQAAPGLPVREPSFLNLETAQYYLKRFVEPYIQGGIFDSLRVPRPRLIAQILDNMYKAALSGITLEETEMRLVAAWGNRHSSRQQIYKVSTQIALQYRAFCLQNNLLDFGLMVELFSTHLLGTPVFENYFYQRYEYFIADNIEEMSALEHDFVSWCRENSRQSLLVYDHDGGYRAFLGADPDNAYQLRHACDAQLQWDQLTLVSSPIQSLVSEVSSILAPEYETLDVETSTVDAISFSTDTYYPQMVATCVDQITKLIQQESVSPSQIAIMMPFLSDSLRFALQTGLETANIQSQVYRPSRPLITESAVKALMTILVLAHPEWEIAIPVSDVAIALSLLIDGLDPSRAHLLANIVYRKHLTSFDDINAKMQQRITIEAGERYERLRVWIYNQAAQNAPPDHFLSRLFGEILSQPGYGFHHNFDAARSIDDLVRFAARFRQTIYPHGLEVWASFTRELYELVSGGLVPAHTFDVDENIDAVLIAPAYTFLIANRPVDYQFWLDAGNTGWEERLEQPLTHPYALQRNYEPGAAWTDDMEKSVQETMLKNIVLGLLRRCHKQVFVGITDISESGYEQRGMLLKLCQEILSLQRGTEV
jgi:superfamily I DNA/RNA helicase